MEFKKAKICQSCGMPMKETEDFGSEEDGSKGEEYCRYCYQQGKFTSEISKDEWIERMIKLAVEKMGMKQDEARKMAEHVIPGLKRWKDS
ncbi:MAG: zinc ribbon domain-containing protein [archaeon]